MFVNAQNQAVDPHTWISYSIDGSGTPASMVRGQPVDASPAQLVAMGLTVQPDPTPAPPGPPDIISDRQFFQQLALQGVITNAEALAAVTTGTIPAALAAVVNALPSAQQFNAQMLICGSTTFSRSNPMTETLRQAMGWTSAQTDALWLAASQL